MLREFTTHELAVAWALSEQVQATLLGRHRGTRRLSLCGNPQAEPLNCLHDFGAGDRGSRVSCWAGALQQRSLSMVRNRPFNLGRAKRTVLSCFLLCAPLLSPAVLTLLLFVQPKHLPLAEATKPPPPPTHRSPGSRHPGPCSGRKPISFPRRTSLLKLRSLLSSVLLGHCELG